MSPYLLDFLASQANAGRGNTTNTTANKLPSAYNPALFAQYSQGDPNASAISHLATIGQSIQDARQFADEQAAAAAAKKRQDALIRQIKSMQNGGGSGGKGGSGGYNGPVPTPFPKPGKGGGNSNPLNLPGPGSYGYNNPEIAPTPGGPPNYPDGKTPAGMKNGPSKPWWQAPWGIFGI